MGSTVVLIGTMPSLASLVSLGSFSVGIASSSGSEGSSSSHVRRVAVSRRTAALFRGVRRWHCLSVTTTAADIMASAEQGNAVTEYMFRADGEPVLKPSPKPVLQHPRAEAVSFVELERPRVGGKSGSDGGSDTDDDSEGDEESKRIEMIETLDEVLEKAEKLETSSGGHGSSNYVSSSNTTRSVSGRKENGNVYSVKPSNTVANSRPGGSAGGTSPAARQSKHAKSVWKKGDTVAAAKTVVKQTPSVDKYENVVKQSPSIDNKVVTEEIKLNAPQPIARPPIARQPTLQGKPMVVAPRPTLKKPVVLRDVGKSPDTVTPTKTEAKEKQPILIDKFAKKKLDIDPLVAAAAVVAPTKPGKSPAPGKFKEHRKNASSAGPRRRLGGFDDDKFESKARRGRRQRSKASRKAARMEAEREAAPVKVEILEVSENGMMIEELANNLAITEGDILGYLYSKGIKPDGVQKLGKDMVKLVCNEYEVEVIDADPFKFEEMARKKEIFDEEDLDHLEDRPPVLTIMGHVDHGKTTLLDHIRKTKVAASEAGGITQGIGAYKVLVPVDGKPQSCVFLDTPGHEAFGAMRARGARVTDIAIIVVAADDGIRPQTTEAIAHAKAAGVPIVIAINKIDKDGASAERVMQELSSIGLMPEDWGGDTPMVPVSALNGDNVDDLLETVMLVAELQELKANPNRNAKGTVIEASLHKSKGPVVTFIVQNGTLKKGDIVVCGESFGKVRALFDDLGKQVDNAGPSMPVQVIGMGNVPMAGDEFEVVDSLDIARQRAEERAIALNDERLSAKAGDGKITLSSLASAFSSGKRSGMDLHQLNIILKVDVQGSIEAIKQALQVLPQDNVTLKFLLEAAGDVSKSDVDLAVASETIILGFNVKAPSSVKSYADSNGVEIRLYKVIYDLIDDVRKAMEGLLDPIEEQDTIGSAEVRAVFRSGSGRVAGCMVLEGKLMKGCGIKVTRRRRTVYVGVLESLRRVKEDVKEVAAELECGVGAEGFDEWEEGDAIEAFKTIEKKRTLEEASASMTAALEKVGISK